MNTKLKGYRVMAGFNQAEMAEFLKISSAMYCYCENGQRRFTENQEMEIFNLLKEKLPDLTMEDVFPIEE